MGNTLKSIQSSEIWTQTVQAKKVIRKNILGKIFYEVFEVSSMVSYQDFYPLISIPI